MSRLINNNIIEKVQVGYDVYCQVGYNHLISNKRKWNTIVLLKMPTKYRVFFPTLLIKFFDFQLVSNFEQTRTVTKFGEHGIMACIP